MIAFIALVVFGLVAGVIAKLFMPGNDTGGFLVTTLIGIAGAVAGGYVGRILGLYGPTDPAGFLMAVIGSVILLVLYHAVIANSEMA